MVEFDQVLTSQQDAEAFIAATGGLPGISRAAEDLHSAIDQTRDEIGSAVFASRFPNPPGNNFNVMVEQAQLSPRAKELIAAEGEAGMKRVELESSLRDIEGDLFSIVDRLVRLRCNLIVSQLEG